MESVFKNRLDAQQINMLVQHAFGKKVNEIVENNFGEFSALYMVKLDDREVVLKIAPKDDVRVLRYEKNLMKAEVDTLKRIKENTDVPVPGVLFYDTTRTLCDSEYFFMEKISGTNFFTILPELNAEQKSNFLIQIGKYNRKINDIECEKFGCPALDDKQTDNWKSAFLNLISDLMADGKDADIALPVPYDEIEAVVNSLIFACDDLKNPQLILWDLWPGNVLVENDKVTGIIDLERALWADPLMECYFRRHMINKDFCSGYGLDSSLFGKNEKIRLALYDLYLALVWIIEYHYRRYDDLSMYARREGQFIQIFKSFEDF